ncbi:hypothetical protein E2C01_092540 [Portunus trituberculatus]|uniref:Uncharacterized protein n=1 Tax=Portunus trituberculatus TaxID=210409 RepID=A0A5B7JSB4_PORTR|nr:hypothetical protein [Portunus trituberculatus]
MLALVIYPCPTKYAHPSLVSKACRQSRPPREVMTWASQSTVASIRAGRAVLRELDHLLLSFVFCVVQLTFIYVFGVSLLHHVSLLPLHCTRVKYVNTETQGNFEEEEGRVGEEEEEAEVNMKKRGKEGEKSCNEKRCREGMKERMHILV